MFQEIDQKGVNDAKRLLITLEREEKIITRLIARMGQEQLFGLNASYYSILIEVLLMITTLSLLYYVINRRQIDTLEFFFLAFAIVSLLVLTLRSWINMLQTRRINRITKSLCRTIEGERRIAEDFIDKNLI